MADDNNKAEQTAIIREVPMQQPPARKMQRFDNPDDQSGYDSRTYSAYSLDRMINTGGVYEGPTNLPKVIQGQRIASPTKFRIISQEEQRRQTKFVLAWEHQWDLTKWQPEFLVYYYAQSSFIDWHGQTANTPSFDGPMQGPVIAKASPVEVLVQGIIRRPVVFAIATRLSNGMITSTDLMPRCSGICDPVESFTKVVTTAYTASLEADIIYADPTATGTFTITLPSVNDVPEGFKFWIKNTNVAIAGGVTIAAHAGETVDGAATQNLNAGVPQAVFCADRKGLQFRAF